jgi:hypothetical protein
MDGRVRQMLEYRDGYLALTDTHLVVVRGGYVAESLALKHLSSVSVEEAHSFRHRILGLTVGLALIAMGSGACAGDFNLLAMFRWRVGIGAIFALLFGVVFVFSALGSRRIWWLRVRYANTPKRVPLAGAEQTAVEQFATVVCNSVVNPH